MQPPDNEADEASRGEAPASGWLTDELARRTKQMGAVMLVQEPGSSTLLPIILYNRERHDRGGGEAAGGEPSGIVSKWRQKDRMKTTAVALVLCLNIGVDPPDVIKISPCARLQCWVDPHSMQPAKSLDAIGKSLQAQYERWQPRARYKMQLDPTVDDVKKLCLSSRRNAKAERVLLHYNGHGVPRPTVNGELWVFNKSYTQYIPLSVYDLQTWVGTPCIYVLDCSAAGLVVNAFCQFAEQRQKEVDVNMFGGQPQGVSPMKDCILLAACAADELLPQSADLPADVFTACLTTPIKTALHWFCSRSLLKDEGLNLDLIDSIPGRQNDRKTPLGELNWIFTAITDTIAWNMLPRPLFQKLFRQDLLVASLYRNFLLAERIMRGANCTPQSFPRLVPTHQHPMWLAWDLAAEMCLAQLPKILSGDPNVDFTPSPFFSEHLTAFEVWLEHGGEGKKPPEQLPIVLQVLLSQSHRFRALVLLGRFLDMGAWAVDLALSVGIFPYVLKLLQTTAPDLRQILVFIWTKILALDRSCQVDLVKDTGHLYFIKFLDSGNVPGEHRAMAAFVLACICDGHPKGQAVCAGSGLRQVCIGHIPQVAAGGQSPLLLRWLCFALGQLCDGAYDVAQLAIREGAIDACTPLLGSGDPEVRAASVFALASLVQLSLRGGVLGADAGVLMTDGERLAAERMVGCFLIPTVEDASPLVRQEVAIALARVICGHAAACRHALSQWHHAQGGRGSSHAATPAGGAAPRHGRGGGGSSHERPPMSLDEDSERGQHGSGAALEAMGRRSSEDRAAGWPGGRASASPAAVKAAAADALASPAPAAAAGPPGMGEIGAASPEAGEMTTPAPAASRMRISSDGTPNAGFADIAMTLHGSTPEGTPIPVPPPDLDLSNVYLGFVEAVCQLAGDPSPSVAGMGRAALRAAGIEVSTKWRAEQDSGVDAPPSAPQAVEGTGRSSPKVSTSWGPKVGWSKTSSMGSSAPPIAGVSAPASDRLAPAPSDVGLGGRMSMDDARDGPAAKCGALALTLRDLVLIDESPESSGEASAARCVAEPLLQSSLYKGACAYYSHPLLSGDNKDIISPPDEASAPRAPPSSRDAQDRAHAGGRSKLELKLAMDLRRRGEAAAMHMRGRTVKKLSEPLASTAAEGESAGSGGATAIALLPFSPVAVASDAGGHIRVSTYDASSHSVHTVHSWSVLSGAVAGDGSTAGHGRLEEGSPESHVVAIKVLNTCEPAASSVLLTGTADGAVRLWKGFAQRGAGGKYRSKLVSAFRALAPPPRRSAAAFHPSPACFDFQESSGMLYAGGSSSMVHVWSLDQEVCARKDASSESPVTALATAGGLVAAGLGSGGLRIVDPRTPEGLVLSEQVFGANVSVGGVAILGLGSDSRAVVGSVHGELAYLDLRGGAGGAGGAAGGPEAGGSVFQRVHSTQGLMTSFAAHPNGPLVATGGGDRTVRVWDAAGEAVDSIRPSGSFIAARAGLSTCLAWHPYQAVLAVGTNEAGLSLYGSGDAGEARWATHAAYSNQGH